MVLLPTITPLRDDPVNLIGGRRDIEVSDRYLNRRNADPPMMKTYFVLIPGLNVIGGKPVDQNRTVRLSAEQAQYWLDQGAISEQHQEETKAGAALGAKSKREAATDVAKKTGGRRKRSDTLLD